MYDSVTDLKSFGSQVVSYKERLPYISRTRLNCAGKDVFWYTREKQEDGTDPRVSEIALVKQREEELMMEVYSLFPRLRPTWLYTMADTPEGALVPASSSQKIGIQKSKLPPRDPASHSLQKGNANSICSLGTAILSCSPTNYPAWLIVKIK